MVGFQVGYLWYEIGKDDFLKSWFSSINYHLEKCKWGNKYPLLMNNFYRGEILNSNLEAFKKEVLETKKELKKIKPKDVIWDIEDRSKQPPWGDKISKDITSLANYYITCNGKDYYEILLKAIDRAIEDNSNIEIKNI